MNYNYFIIHGSFGSPFGNWFSWLYDFVGYVKRLEDIKNRYGKESNIYKKAENLIDNINN